MDKKTLERQLVKAKQQIRRMTLLDKDDSHKKAILKAMDERDEINKQIKEITKKFS